MTSVKHSVKWYVGWVLSYGWAWIPPAIGITGIGIFLGTQVAMLTAGFMMCAFGGIYLLARLGVVLDRIAARLMKEKED